LGTDLVFKITNLTTQGSAKQKSLSSALASGKAANDPAAPGVPDPVGSEVFVLQKTAEPDFRVRYAGIIATFVRASTVARNLSLDCTNAEKLLPFSDAQ
jgi:hypothetical protein